MKDSITAYLKELQDTICHELEVADDKSKFKEDAWEHGGGGGGRTRVITKGRIIEKGGVNFSEVRGKATESIKKTLELTQDADFLATGISIVLHPENPFVPIIHMNVRYFELSTGQCWFGGGIDLTPHYVDPKQAKVFHEKLKTVCDQTDATFYPAFKKWADEYFFIKHRGESRGIGGIFYDYLKPDTLIPQTGTKHSKEELFEFMKSVGNVFVPIYLEMIQHNHSKAFTSEEKKWQYIRRGRYAEFNLVWDRGTRFGLESNGRIESILMSLPPHASWDYNLEPKEESKEYETLQYLRNSRDWVE
jgi:coproporphyrinogen III oxidase